MEFERILSASGPFGGHVLRPSDGQEPRRLAFLQCVGSRDVSCRNAYCSSVCCMYAIKEAIIAKEHLHGVEPTIFVMDIRAFGKDFDAFAERAKNEYKIPFVYARVSDVVRDPATGRSLVIYADEAGQVRREPFDLVVLSVGLEPSDRFRSLARGLGARLNPYGFLATHPFRPLATSREGVFAAGAATGPKDIPETVIQAGAAACEASRFLARSRGTLVAERAFPPERNLAGEPVRIGVFICHCGINIGSVVNVPAVRDFAATLPGVAYADQNLYTCSQDTQKLMKERILEHRLNRIVVASCSPRTHEALFRETLREAGLNPYLFVMANIRDQCSWVHQREPEKATEKSCDLVRMAVAKARLVEPLQPVKLPVTPSALVLGGGLAGLTAAEAIADQGYEVRLVEQAPELGGNLHRLQATLEGHDLRALRRDTEARVRAHPRVTVHAGTTLREIKGFVGNYETTLSDGTIWKHGVVVVATGAKPYQPTEFGYGSNPGVMTQLELAERLEQADPGPAPAHVVMIQCVGSREDPRPYCSRVCCSKAVQNALRLKERFPGVQVAVLYRDMRTYALREAFYAEARDKGVMFLRFDLDHRPRVEPAGSRLAVTVHDPLLGRDLRLDADWLVLSTGIVADADANDTLAKQLKVPLNQDGFFLEAHVKLRPVEFATEGVFLAGLAHGPKTVDESIAQALAAASRACVLLSRKELEASGSISEADPERCMACGLCEHVCAFGAITLENVRIGRQDRLAAKINPALCKGCGACSASCRSGAITLRGFTDEQILAEIASL
jgi:heterodisulfide reductase subunit A